MAHQNRVYMFMGKTWLERSYKYLMQIMELLLIPRLLSIVLSLSYSVFCFWLHSVYKVPF